MVSKSEKEKQHEEKMKAAKAMLLGQGKPATSERAKHRKVIGKPSRHRKHTGNVYATGFKSDALGVNPEQIPEATAALRANGVMNDFDPETGACIITSPNDHKKVARAAGMFSGRDGFDVKDADGKSDLTGRGKVKARRTANKKLLDDIANDRL